MSPQRRGNGNGPCTAPNSTSRVQSSSSATTASSSGDSPIADQDQDQDQDQSASTSRGFGSADFVGFTFDEEEGEEDGGVDRGVGNDASVGPSRPNGHSHSHSQVARLQSRLDTTPNSSGRSTPIRGPGSDRKGKKRKVDSVDEDAYEEGLSKKERERAAARGTPWSGGVRWDTARNAAQMLHREMIAFEKWISPTAEEHQSRKMVIALIRKAIVSQWRDADVLSFGSQDTELYLPQGDIDLVVVSRHMESQRREGVLRSMAACLRRNNLATDVQVIARAKVPIIKFVCTHGRYRCDISVNQTNGLQAADFVNRIQTELPAVRPIILLTKHFLQQRGMSEVYTGGLGSYSVILMVINFMQLHPKIQRGEIDATRNLGTLFLEFLELYGKNFGYDDTGVSVRQDGNYFSKMHRGWQDQGKPFKLSIEDPHQPDNDIATGSYNILQVRKAFAGGFDMLTKAVSERGYHMARGRRDISVLGQARPGLSETSSGSHRRFDEEADPDAAAREALLRGGERQEAKFGGEGLEKDPHSLLGTIIGVSRELIKSRRDIEKLYHSGILQRLLGRPPPRQSPSPGPSFTRRGDMRQASQSSPPPPPPPDAPPRIPSPPTRNPSHSPTKRRQGETTGVKNVINIKGAADRAKQHRRDDEATPPPPPMESTPLRARPSKSRKPDVISIASASDGDEEEEEEDSRYASAASHGQGPSGSTSKRHLLQQQQRRKGPKAYVSEESDSAESDDSHEEGELSTASTTTTTTSSSSGSASGYSQSYSSNSNAKRMKLAHSASGRGKTTANSKEEEKSGEDEKKEKKKKSNRSRNRNYWLDKGAIVDGESESESGSDDYDGGVNEEDEED